MSTAWLHPRKDREVRVNMPSCESCGRHVSMTYARVFADSHGRVDGCPNCGYPGEGTAV